LVQRIRIGSQAPFDRFQAGFVAGPYYRLIAAVANPGNASEMAGFDEIRMTPEAMRSQGNRGDRLEHYCEP
jgi:hypothetical protein